jgi:hypothetical protein
MGSLEIEFFQSLTSVISKPTNLGVRHDAGLVSSKSLRYGQVARSLFTELAGPSGEGANRNYNHFDRVVIKSDNTREMLDEARLDWLDTDYVREATKAIITERLPTYTLPENFSVTVTKGYGGVDFRTSLNLNEIDTAYQELHPGSGPTINPGYILVKIADARLALQTGSRLGSEFAVSPIQGKILEAKFKSLLRKSTESFDASAVFHESVIKGLPSIRDSVNSGQRNFTDVIKLVEQAAQFKSWLSGQNSDESLRDNYLRDVAHLDWAEKLPPKSLRWLLITAAGLGLGATTHPLLGTAAGTILSAADAFLLDKLLKGWKPNQFIEGSLKPFLK